VNPIAASSAMGQIGQLQDATKVGSGSPLTAPGGSGGPGGTGKTNGAGGFADLVSHFVEQTNSDQVSADTAIKDFATGKNDNVQDVVLAMTNADMSFQLFMEIRNHIIDSYNELMRMQF
jgi:flagellar hook-basal body complex protein FliE